MRFVPSPGVEPCVSIYHHRIGFTGIVLSPSFTDIFCHFVGSTQDLTK